MPDRATKASAAGRSEAAAFDGRDSVMRRVAAVVTAGMLVTLVACDLWVGNFRSWWDRHSLTGSVVSSLLVVGVTALIFDEVVARRQRKERAVSVAVQALIVYEQTSRTYDAVAVAAGDGEAAAQAQASAAPEEMRSLANMLLVASPSLFDDPAARLFLKAVQRLAGTMYGSLSSLSAVVASSPSRPKPGSDHVARLRVERSQVEARIKPLEKRIPSHDRAALGDETGSRDLGA